MNIHWMIDILLLAIIIYCIWKGNRDGLIKVVCQTLSYVGALVCARLFSEPFGNWLNKNILHSLVYDHVSDMLTDIHASNDIEGIVGAISEKFSGIIQLFNIDIFKLVDGAANNPGDIMEGIAESISSVISFSVANLLSFAAVFTVALFLLKSLSKILIAVGRLPVIKFFNKAGGALIGTLKGFLLSWILVQVGVYVIALFMPQLNFSIEQTHIANALYNIFQLSFLQ